MCTKHALFYFALKIDATIIEGVIFKFEKICFLYKLQYLINKAKHIYIFFRAMQIHAITVIHQFYVGFKENLLSLQITNILKYKKKLNFKQVIYCAEFKNQF